MARLRSPSGDELLLLPLHTVGRQPGVALRIEDAAGLVSRLHASFQWAGQSWEIRDLGSRNGTFLGGRRVERGATLPLTQGDALGFGAPTPTWTMVDDTAPAAAALGLDGTPDVASWAGMLVLPDGEGGEVVLASDGQDAWRWPDGRPALDGEEHRSPGGRWRLSLPDPSAGTAAPAPQGPPRFGLRFLVGDQEDRVALQVSWAGTTRTLPARAHHLALRVLASERLRGLRRGARFDEAGWLGPSELADHLGITTTHLHVHLWRARAQLAEAGLSCAEHLVERRATGEIRIGSDDLWIGAAGATPAGPA